MVALNQNGNQPTSAADTAPKHRKTPSDNNSFPTNRIRSLLRARYYDTHTAEFLSTDPLEYVDGMSLFRGYFVPNMVDSYGLSPCGDIYKKCISRCGNYLSKGHLRCVCRCRKKRDSCTSSVEESQRILLLGMLKAMCDSCPDECEEGCTKQQCLQDSEAISSAIFYTLRNNYRMNSGWLKRLCGITDHRHKGYYCYEWSYGLEDAVNQFGSKCFSATTDGSALDKDGSTIHVWIFIRSSCSGKLVYVDDGFSNDENIYVHNEEPNCGFPYDFISPGRDECRPVTPYNDQGNSTSN